MRGLRKIALILISVLFVFCTGASCSGSEPNVVLGQAAGFALAHSAGTAENGDQYGYDTNMFYRNETQIEGADPGSIYVSKEDAIDSYNKYKRSFMYEDNGEWKWIDTMTEQKFVDENGTEQDWIDNYSDTYYMVTTGSISASSQSKERYGNDLSVGAFYMARSNDLVDWKRCGLIDGYAVAIYSYDWSIKDFWAPELIRDKVTGLYFIFFSASTKDGNANTTYPTTATENLNHRGGVAMSENPLGPYEMITAEDYITIKAAKNKDGSVKIGTELITNEFNGAKYYEVYGTDGKVVGYKNGNIFYNLIGYEVNNDTPITNPGYYFPRYTKGTESKIAEMDKSTNEWMNVDGKMNYNWRTIDLFPAVDDDGNLYCYYSGGKGQYYGNWVVEMLDYISPNWATMRLASLPGISIIKDNGTLYGDRGDPTEVDEGNCNEAPEVVYHEGRWYYTYSYFGYTDVRYSVGLAVAESPLGPFDKFGGKYNPLLGKGEEGNNYKGGTGHHVFIKAGDELFILYHATNNPDDNYDNADNYLGRHIAVDRGIWKYDADLGYDMLYCNGATVNLQPKPETYTGYENVAKYATVTGNGDVGDLSYLNDGLFTAQPFSRIYEYGKSDGQLEFTLKWDSPMEIKAIMIYNAGGYYHAFNKVNTIRFKLSEKPSWYSLSEYNGYCYIKNLPVDANDQIKQMSIVRHGSAAIAQFSPIKVTEMVVYLSGDKADKYTDEDEYGDIEEGYKEVHVSDVYVFGNRA